MVVRLVGGLFNCLMGALVGWLAGGFGWCRMPDESQGLSLNDVTHWGGGPHICNDGAGRMRLNVTSRYKNAQNFKNTKAHDHHQVPASPHDPSHRTYASVGLK